MLKYQNIAQKIYDSIYQQQLPKGSQLANIEELINQYQVSRTTIVKALARLERQGVIYQVQGSGIFVRQRKKSGYLNLATSHGFTDDLGDLPGFTQVLAFDVIRPNTEIQANLNCNSDEEIYYIKRLRYADGKIYGLEHSYYRKKLIPYLNKEIAKGSIFEYITQTGQINIGFSDKYIELLTIDESTARYLKLPVSSTALFMHEIFYTSAGEPFDFSTIIYHKDNAKFCVQSHAK